MILVLFTSVYSIKVIWQTACVDLHAPGTRIRDRSGQPLRSLHTESLSWHGIQVDLDDRLSHIWAANGYYPIGMFYEAGLP